MRAGRRREKFEKIASLKDVFSINGAAPMLSRIGIYSIGMLKDNKEFIRNKIGVDLWKDQTSRALF